MSSTKSRQTSSIEDALDLDVFECDLAEVDAELRSKGADPVEIARWGASAAEGRRDTKTLDWRLNAQRALQAALSKGAPVRGDALPSDRGALLSMVESLRHRMGATAEVAFRKREPSTADADELKMLIEELMLLDELGGDDEDEEP